MTEPATRHTKSARANPWRPRAALSVLSALLCAAGALLQACSSTPTAPTEPRTRQMVRSGDASIDVVVEGRGPAVVLLPSSLRDSLDFDALAERIAAQGHRVLRPQPRGMARSTGPTEGQTLNTMARDVVAVVDALGGGRAVLVGHAYGHFVARVADLDHPAKVRGVVVLGASQKQISQDLLGALALGSDPGKPRDDRLKALQFSMFAPGNDASVWLDGWYPGLRRAYSAAVAATPRDSWWPVSNSPILDLQGAQDPWRPAASRDELKAVLPGKVTVQVIEGTSHAMVPERPNEVADAIVQWIKGLAP